MDDYIKRGDIAKLAIEEKRFVFQMKDLLKQEIVVKTVYKDFLDFIKSIPAADVVPVRHGRWILIETDEEQFFFCSECENKEYWESNFCPSCGAKMDGGGDG